LQEVERLKKDLSAEIVVDEGHEGYWDVIEHGKYSSGGTYREEKGAWIEGRPRTTEPDTDKRTSATQRLNQIHDSSPWYSARYQAAKTEAIELSAEMLALQADDWVLELSSRTEEDCNARLDLAGLYHVVEKRETRCRISEALGMHYIHSLSDDLAKRTRFRKGVFAKTELLIDKLKKEKRETTRKTEMVTKVEHEEVYPPGKEGYYGAARLVPHERSVPKTVVVPTENAIKAERELRRLYEIHPLRVTRQRIARILSISEARFLADELLKGATLTERELADVLCDRAVPKQARKEAGKALGYSKLRIWWNGLF